MNYAYVTLATTERFLVQAQYLQASLRIVKSKYKLILMISEELKDHKQLSFFDNVIIIPSATFFYQHERVERYKNTINKFYAYNFIDYDKLIFIDADVVLVKNIDDIFNLTPKLVVSTYSPKGEQKELNYPSNGIILLTPEKGKYEFFLEFSKTSSSITDDEALFYNLYLDNFNNQVWTNEINTFENLNYNKKFTHIHNNDFFYYWMLRIKKVTPIKFSLLQNEKNLSLFLIEMYREMIDEHTRIQFPRDELQKKFEEIGSLKHYNRDKFYENI